MSTNTQEIKRYHFVYRITNIVEQMYYYGTRTTSKKKERLPEEELGITYFSSKVDNSFQKDQKENPQNYKYKILKVFSTREEALEMEIMLHKKFNVKLHKQFYNESNQTSTGFDTTGVKYSEERKAQISKDLTGRPGYVRTKKHKDNVSKVHKNMIGVRDKNGNKFKVHKLDPKYISGEYTPVAKGIKKSKEYLDSIGDSRLGLGSYNYVVYNEKNVKVCEGKGIENIIKDNNLPKNIKRTYFNNTKLYDSNNGLAWTIKQGNEKYVGWYMRLLKD